MKLQDVPSFSTRSHTLGHTLGQSSHLKSVDTVVGVHSSRKESSLVCKSSEDAFCTPSMPGSLSESVSSSVHGNDGFESKPLNSMVSDVLNRGLLSKPVTIALVLNDSHYGVQYNANMWTSQSHLDDFSSTQQRNRLYCSIEEQVTAPEEPTSLTLWEYRLIMRCKLLQKMLESRALAITRFGKQGTVSVAELVEAGVSSTKELTVVGASAADQLQQVDMLFYRQFQALHNLHKTELQTKVSVLQEESKLAATCIQECLNFLTGKSQDESGLLSLFKDLVVSSNSSSVNNNNAVNQSGKLGALDRVIVAEKPQFKAVQAALLTKLELHGSIDKVWPGVGRDRDGVSVSRLQLQESCMLGVFAGQGDVHIENVASSSLQYEEGVLALFQALRAQWVLSERYYRGVPALRTLSEQVWSRCVDVLSGATVCDSTALFLEESKRDSLEGILQYCSLPSVRSAQTALVQCIQLRCLAIQAFAGARAQEWSERCRGAKMAILASSQTQLNGYFPPSQHVDLPVLPANNKNLATLVVVAAGGLASESVRFQLASASTTILTQDIAQPETTRAADQVPQNEGSLLYLASPLFSSQRGHAVNTTSSFNLLDAEIAGKATTDSWTLFTQMLPNETTPQSSFQWRMPLPSSSTMINPSTTTAVTTANNSTMVNVLKTTDHMNPLHHHHNQHHNHHNKVINNFAVDGPKELDVAVLTPVSSLSNHSTTYGAIFGDYPRGKGQNFAQPQPQQQQQQQQQQQHHQQHQTQQQSQHLPLRNDLAFYNNYHYDAYPAAVASPTSGTMSGRRKAIAKTKGDFDDLFPSSEGSDRARAPQPQAMQYPPQAYMPNSGSGGGAGGRGASVIPNNTLNSNGTRKRQNFPPEIIAILEGWLAAHWDQPYPTQDEKACLALQTGLSVEQISHWYINTRMRKWRKAQKESKNNEKRQKQDEYNNMRRTQ